MIVDMVVSIYGDMSGVFVLSLVMFDLVMCMFIMLDLLIKLGSV